MGSSTITNTGGNYILEGDLGIDMPANAVLAPNTVTTTLIGNPPASSGYVVHRTWHVNATAAPLLALGRLHHPAVNGVDETKFRFYTSAAAGNMIPGAAIPIPDSPWMPDVVNGQTGYLPPKAASPAANPMYVSLVEIP